MFVAASSECFPDLSFEDMLQRVVDLEYTSLELAVHENGGHLKPSEVHANLERAVDLCRSTLRLSLCALSTDILSDGKDSYERFASICKLAKSIKVVAVVIPSAELGTPFNAEVERLREMVKIAVLDGVQVGVKTEIGRMTQDADTTMVLCDNVRGLGVALDPSCFLCGPSKSGSYDQILKYVTHVHLRDSTKEKFQVRVGQGEIEYSKLLAQLGKVKYQRVLSVHIKPMEGVDHDGEMRKMRLLLESLL